MSEYPQTIKARGQWTERKVTKIPSNTITATTMDYVLPYETNDYNSVYRLITTEIINMYLAMLASDIAI